MKQNRLTVADEIEISLRSGNLDKQAKLNRIETQCDFVLENSTNVSLKQFAEIVKLIIIQTL